MSYAPDDESIGFETDDVFLWPSCVLTNVLNPQSQVRRKALYEKTLIKRGAIIDEETSLPEQLSVGKVSYKYFK